MGYRKVSAAEQIYYIIKYAAAAGGKTPPLPSAPLAKARQRLPPLLPMVQILRAMPLGGGGVNEQRRYYYRYYLRYAYCVSAYQQQKEIRSGLYGFSAA